MICLWTLKTTFLKENHWVSNPKISQSLSNMVTLSSSIVLSWNSFFLEFRVMMFKWSGRCWTCRSDNKAFSVVATALQANPINISHRLSRILVTHNLQHYCFYDEIYLAEDVSHFRFLENFFLIREFVVDKQCVN